MLITKLNYFHKANFWSRLSFVLTMNWLAEEASQTWFLKKVPCTSKMTWGEMEFCRGGSMVAMHWIVVPLYSSGTCINVSTPRPLPMWVKAFLTSAIPRFSSEEPFRSQLTAVTRSDPGVCRAHETVALQLTTVTTFPAGNNSTKKLLYQTS